MTEFQTVLSKEPDSETAVTMYWGTGSGSASKTLRVMEEPNVMISYTTAQQPWNGIDNLFIDSGGYSLMLETGEHGPVSDYFEYVSEVDASIVALQDYPCEPEILEEYNRTVEQHQQLTIERAVKNLNYIEDHGIEATPMAVLQGWETEDYIRCIDRFRNAGVLTDYVGIGTVCRRNATSEIQDIVLCINKELPSRKLHAFGVKKEILTLNDVRAALDSVDTTAWYYNMYGEKPPAEQSWHATTKEYLDYKRGLYELFDRQQTGGSDWQRWLCGE